MSSLYKIATYAASAFALTSSIAHAQETLALHTQNSSISVEHQETSPLAERLKLFKEKYGSRFTPLINQINRHPDAYVMTETQLRKVEDLLILRSDVTCQELGYEIMSILLGYQINIDSDIPDLQNSLPAFCLKLTS